MYKGIYIAASGAVLKQRQMDTITQNLANADTVGYKKQTISFKDYLVDPSAPEADGRTMTTLSASSIDYSSGSVIRTGNPLDVSIEGDGFIGLDDNHFTRRGDLHVDAEGYLTTFNGEKVLGASGNPIQLPDPATDVTITEHGGISVNGSEVDTIMIRDFPDTSALTPTGGGIYTASTQGTDSTSMVRQGSLERSNVEVITEMVQMIESLREFESYQKVIQTFDAAADKVNNDLAKM